MIPRAGAIAYDCTGSSDKNAVHGWLPDGEDRPRMEIGPNLSEPTHQQIDFIAQTYKLLGDATRLRILLVCLEGPLPVNEIARRTAASPSLVSHHLRLLRGARLVRGSKQNRQVLYELDDEHIRHMLMDMIDHAAEQ